MEDKDLGKPGQQVSAVSERALGASSSDGENVSSQAKMRGYERIVLLAERFPWSAIYRVTIGYFTVAIFSRFTGLDVPGWSIVFWFIGMLLGLRLIPAILRKVLPFSEQTAAVWAEQRMMAKRFDSYQWRKLFWFGLGAMLYGILSGRFGVALTILTAFFLISGALGYLVWQRTAVTAIRNRGELH